MDVSINKNAAPKAWVMENHCDTTFRIYVCIVVYPFTNRRLSTEITVEYNSYIYKPQLPLSAFHVSYRQGV